jgi:hypothetical protein
MLLVKSFKCGRQRDDDVFGFSLQPDCAEVERCDSQTANLVILFLDLRQFFRGANRAERSIREERALNISEFKIPFGFSISVAAPAVLVPWTSKYVHVLDFAPETKFVRSTT